MMPQWHPQANQMRTVLKRERRIALYHFTDIENLALISRFEGLRSKEFLEQKGVLDQIKTGGNTLSKSLDQRHGNWDKVSLSWCPKLPMVWYREQEQHLCYVVVNLSAALQPGVVFTDRNATDNYHERRSGLQGVQIVNFNAVRQNYPYPNTEIKKQKQAEILVPNHIPITEFDTIIFRSESSHQEAIRLCSSNLHLRDLFQVDERLFILPSAYTKSHTLTADSVNKSNVNINHLHHQTSFSKRRVPVITLLLEVYATFGTKETVKWLCRDNHLIREKTGKFGSTSSYYTWSSLNLRDLATGDYMVDYYLSGRSDYIQQVRIPFQITP